MRTLQTMLAGMLLLLGWVFEIVGIAIGGEGRQENPFASVGPEDEYPPCRTVGEAWRAAVHDVEHWLVYVNWKRP
jgi:hypothetical protein